MQSRFRMAQPKQTRQGRATFPLGNSLKFADHVGQIMETIPPIAIELRANVLDFWRSYGLSL